MNTAYKFYFLTLVFILALFKRQFPKWMQKKAIEVLAVEVNVGKVEKYER